MVVDSQETVCIANAVWNLCLQNYNFMILYNFLVLVDFFLNCVVEPKLGRIIILQSRIGKLVKYTLFEPEKIRCRYVFFEINKT